MLFIVLSKPIENKVVPAVKFASYVIYSIKQTFIINSFNCWCLLVMLFIVLSKRMLIIIRNYLSLLVMLFIVLSKLGG